MKVTDDETAWARDTFGAIDLGDERRTRRLVSIAAALARAPSGQVMAAIQGPAEREAAFRFLGSKKFDAETLGDGITRSTLTACTGVTYCAVDGSSISLSDAARSRNIGGVGSWRKSGRGMQAITMVAANRDGAPVGPLGPQWWARTRPSQARKYKSHKSLETETRHVVSALRRVETVRRSVPSNALLWFQLDRGFDAWPVFQLAHELSLLVTVRSSANRRIRTEDGGTEFLYPTVERTAPVGSYTVRVPRQPKRPAREATLSVRIATVQLVLQVGRKRQEVVPVSVVYAQEEGYTGKDRLRWVLLTTAEVTDFAGACAVIHGYTTRWLIEELHRAWKDGWMGVEQTQLRRQNSICKWATLHLAVAARALRLTRLARTEPDRAASDELSRDEIDAILLLNVTVTKNRLGDVPSLAHAVLLLAEIGGYDRYSKKPPGATVIGRGLERIAPLAAGLARLRAEK